MFCYNNNNDWIENGNNFDFKKNYLDILYLSKSSFTELTTDAQGGFISADALSVSSSTNRVEIRSDRIEVYAGGQLRVKIGNLA